MTGSHNCVQLRSVLLLTRVTFVPSWRAQSTVDFLDKFKQANICSLFETATINGADQQRIAHI